MLPIFYNQNFYFYTIFFVPFLHHFFLFCTIFFSNVFSQFLFKNVFANFLYLYCRPNSYLPYTEFYDINYPVVPCNFIEIFHFGSLGGGKSFLDKKVNKLNKYRKKYSPWSILHYLD